MPQRVAYTFVAIDKFTAVAERIRRKASSVKKEFGDLGKRSKEMSANLKKGSSELAFFAAKASAVGLVIGGLGIAAVAQAAKFEQFEVAFAVLAGSAEKGTALFGELKTFAAKTPFQLEGIAESAKILLAFGVGAEDVTKNLTMLGDLAAGTGKPLEEFALIFGKIKAKGKVTGEELQQLAEKGINLREALGTKFGLTTAQVEKAISKGAVKFEHVLQVMQDMTAEGARFGGMMEKQSRTIGGRWSTLKDNVSLAGAEMGKVIIEQTALGSLMDKISGKLEKVTDGFASWVKVHPTLVKVGLVLAGIVVVLGPLLLMIASVGFLLSGAIAGFGALATIVGMLTLPMLSIAFAIGLVIAAGAMLAMQWSNLKLSFSLLSQGIGEEIDMIKESISSFAGGLGGSVLKFLGVGADAGATSSQTDVNINLNDPGGAVQSTSSKTSGDQAGLNVGLNMATAF